MPDGSGSDPLLAPAVPSPMDVSERQLLDASVELIQASNCESVARGQLTDIGHALLGAFAFRNN